MYSLKFYIKPEDILDRINRDKYAAEKGFNKCMITDIEKQYDGTVELTCLLFNSEEEIYKDECRYKLIV